MSGCQSVECCNIKSWARRVHAEQAGGQLEDAGVGTGGAGQEESEVSSHAGQHRAGGGTQVIWGAGGAGARRDSRSSSSSSPTSSSSCSCSGPGSRSASHGSSHSSSTSRSASTTSSSPVSSKYVTFFCCTLWFKLLYSSGTSLVQYPLYISLVS